MESKINVYVGLIGGLGDVIYKYLHSEQCRSILPYKKKFPSSSVKAIVVSHNPEAYRILELNPYIDKVVQYPPRREMRDLKWTHQQVIEQYSDGFQQIPTSLKNSTRPKIYLSEWENAYVDHIYSPNMVVMHPFASEDKRKVDIDLSVEVAKKIISYGKRVVVIGSSYTKSFGRSEEYYKQEQFPDLEGITNLIGKINSRICIELISRSNMFVGSWSCYGITSWIYGIKSIVITSKELIDGCRRIHSRKYKSHHMADIVTTPEEALKYL